MDETSRVTMPTILLASTTGILFIWWRPIKCTIWWRSIKCTTSASDASRVTVNTSRVMTSRTLRPLNWTYSSASRPGPIKNSTHLGRRRFVPISSTAQKVAFGNNADKISKTIDNRKTADLLLQHAASGNKHRCNVWCHYSLTFMPGFLICAYVAAALTTPGRLLPRPRLSCSSLGNLGDEVGESKPHLSIRI